MTKLSLSTKTSTNAANQDYEKLMDPAAPVPSAPVHAARLNGLLKTLANAEGAVAESIKARKLLIESLEKLLTTNKAALEAEEAEVAELTRRKEAIDNKKRDVEDSIMRGFTASPVSGTPNQEDSTTPTEPVPEPERPEVEALTPPAFEAFSPHSPSMHEEVPQFTAPQPAAESDLLASLKGPESYSNDTERNISAYGNDREYSNGGGSIKKRKLDGDEFEAMGGDAMDDLDPDVAALLRAD